MKTCFQMTKKSQRSKHVLIWISRFVTKLVPKLSPKHECTIVPQVRVEDQWQEKWNTKGKKLGKLERGGYKTHIFRKSATCASLLHAKCLKIWPPGIQLRVKCQVPSAKCQVPQDLATRCLVSCQSPGKWSVSAFVSFCPLLSAYSYSFSLPENWKL